MRLTKALISINNKKATELDGSQLPLMESFYTIQGEGYHTGVASYFIRTAGCNVGCHWCDVKDSWDANAYPLVDVDQIAKKVAAHKMKIAVVTGGESFMFNMQPLTDALAKEGIQRHVETSGAYPFSGDWEWICLSPKKAKKPLEENLGKAQELKVVIYNQSDFKWAEEFAAAVSKDCKLYLQPEWNKSYMMMPKIVDYIKEHPQWQISLQTHKYMNIP
jgi:organic radical activating enzyme